MKINPNQAFKDSKQPKRFTAMQLLDIRCGYCATSLTITRRKWHSDDDIFCPACGRTNDWHLMAQHNKGAEPYER